MKPTTERKIENNSKDWVVTGCVEPPQGVVSARFGASVFFASYSRALRQWYMVANGREEKIPEPEMIFTNQPVVRQIQPKKLDLKPRQLQLF